MESVYVTFNLDNPSTKNYLFAVLVTAYVICTYMTHFRINLIIIIIIVVVGREHLNIGCFC